MVLKPKSGHNLCTLKKHSYHIVNGYSITGDAPKKFIRVYRYGTGRKSSPKTWSLYIAKTGHKWYPIESVTEYLLNQLGCKLGLKMAESHLVYAGHQLRFLSKYFLKSKYQELVHGAEIFVGYLEDEDKVQKIELEGKAREVFTLDLVYKSMEKFCGDDTDGIYAEFIKMLIFDALIGNNDRHFYNWGIIRHTKSLEKPYFSPIYDTARGLFWNNPEKKIITLYNNPHNLAASLEKYSKNSRPKTGVDGNPNINHYELISHIYHNEVGITKANLKAMINEEALEQLLYCINVEFRHLLSTKRRFVISEYLKLRYNKIVSLFN